MQLLNYNLFQYGLLFRTAGLKPDMPMGAEAWHELSREVMPRMKKPLWINGSAQKTPHLPIRVERTAEHEVGLGFHVTAHPFTDYLKFPVNAGPDRGKGKGRGKA